MNRSNNKIPEKSRLKAGSLAHLRWLLVVTAFHRCPSVCPDAGTDALHTALAWTNLQGFDSKYIFGTERQPR